MKFLPLSQNKLALVDDEDFEYLSQWKWYYSGKYAVRTPRGKRGQTPIRLHRTIMVAGPGFEVDHINGDRLDNRKINLRVCSHNENGKNLSLSVHNTSGYKGVVSSSGKWRARIRVDGNLRHLGYFEDKLEASHAYDNAALRFFGKFARLDNV